MQLLLPCSVCKYIVGKPMKGIQGTGSYPLPPHGLHLRMRHIASASPFSGPCFMRACRAYSEHVGVKRHDGGVKGEITC